MRRRRRGLGRLAAMLPPNGMPSRIGEEKVRGAVAGKVVLVTGASYGVGEATSRRLAQGGATVLMAARSADRLEEIAAEIRSGGGDALAKAVDMLDAQSVDALATWALSQHGHIDVVVSNAGKSIRRSVELSYDRFHDVERTLGVNYLGPVRLLLALLPSMRARGQGHVVNVATTGIRMAPGARWGAYLGSKSAFDMWLRSAAPELRADGVATTAIYIGLVHTRMSAPTPYWRYMPGQTPEEAAGTVCRALARRPRVLAPWWLTPAELVATVARTPAEAIAGAHFRLSSDTAAARGGATGVEQPSGDASPLREAMFRADMSLRAVKALREAGTFASLRRVRPHAIADIVRRGSRPETPLVFGAARFPQRPAIVDERGAITFAELDRRRLAIADGLRRLGVGPAAGVAVMCRNHRGFVEAMAAGSSLGADVLMIGTDFPAAQLARILARERPAALVYDQEFESVVDQSGFEGARVVAWQDEETGLPTLDRLASGPPIGSADAQSGRIVMLTSGTTGAPKSAPRSPSREGGLATMATVLSRAPLRSGEPILVAPPAFHGFGFFAVSLGLLLGSPLVMQRRFNPEAVLAAIERDRVGTLIAVPVMLDRILRCLRESKREYDTSSLQVILSGGSMLPAATGAAIAAAFGDVLYNLYGSTEAGIAGVATPADLQAAPGTVGRPSIGVRLKILDEARREAPPGQTGHVFVGNPLTFDGYGGDEAEKETVGGLINTGDLGHLDQAGRLMLDGREDEMIVSGGENVFPQEVTAVLGEHGAVFDVAVVGVDDEEFGQRLRAYVVPVDGMDPTPAELRDHIKGRLPRFQIPRDFVFIEEIPRTASGKVRAHALEAARD